MNTGEIKFYIESKGYGFITDKESGQDFFFHASALTEEVEKGDVVEFDLAESQHGFKAQDIKKINN